MNKNPSKYYSLFGYIPFLDRKYPAHIRLKYYEESEQQPIEAF
jgi:hypothetical protein